MSRPSSRKILTSSQLQQPPPQLLASRLPCFASFCILAINHHLTISSITFLWLCIRSRFPRASLAPCIRSSLIRAHKSYLQYGWQHTYTTVAREFVASIRTRSVCRVPGRRGGIVLHLARLGLWSGFEDTAVFLPAMPLLVAAISSRRTNSTWNSSTT
ncbi:hypothetical protein PYCCODRAFT_1202869 [Trametes coccinea BRFM310]|uniref:Uncharacterized protein n=1 Tax=Trametes coccinea (strain BRFM310) TaxID=1353009 RepID=A0A1Y2I7C0_TRAC3|nr:hypothetical protein PYCCODRAFT_1202869 [Trametes coccinea BRFM310]